MTWNEYKEGLAKRKAENPQSYDTWKTNLNDSFMIIKCKKNQIFSK